MKNVFEEDYGLKPVWTKGNFPLVKHTFSHQKWQVSLLEGQIDQTDLKGDKDLCWVAPEDFVNYPMATPQKKMIEAYQQKD